VNEPLHPLRSYPRGRRDNLGDLRGMDTELRSKSETTPVPLCASSATSAFAAVNLDPAVLIAPADTSGSGVFWSGFATRATSGP